MKEKIQKISASFEMLGNPLRMQIFLAIVQGGCDCNFNDTNFDESNCVKGIMESLEIPQSTASTYIKDLERVGLVETKKVGKFLYSRPSKKGLLELQIFLKATISQIRYQGK